VRLSWRQFAGREVTLQAAIHERRQMSQPTPEGQSPETSAAIQPSLPDSLDALLALGHRCLDERNFVEAQLAFERALTLEPADVMARHNLGYSLECQGATEAAMAAYEAVVQSPTPLAQSAFNLGVLLARAGRNDEARQAFAQTLDRDPTFARAWVNQGVLHARMGQLEQARQCYEQALAVDPTCHTARLKLANLLARESRREEALAEYARLVEEGWNLAEAQYRRGLTLGVQGDEAAAIHAYESAIEADSGHVCARVQLALLYAQRERYAQATETLQRAADVAPNDVLVQYNLGNMHARQAVEEGDLVNYGYADAAMQAYRRAIELDPKFLKAYYNLACVAEKISVPEGISAWEQYLNMAQDVASEQEWVVKARGYMRSLKNPGREDL
jgi:tetratricopeptide (TPR) repeat protein